MFDADGRIEYANQSLASTFGWRADELIGANIAVLQPAELRAAHVAGLNRFLQSGRRTVDWRARETRGLHHDGHEFAIELAFSHMVMDGHDTFVGFVRNIEARKRSEAEHRAVLQHLRQSQKMESLGTLAGGIAHDFNNILGAILGNTALAREELGEHHPALVNIDEIHKAGLRARDLVRQILAFSRNQPQELCIQSLEPIVEETHKLLHATLPARVVLDVAMCSEPLFVRADATQVQQVLMNLCTNAWHALPDGVGRIGVGLDAVMLDAEGAAALGGLAPGRYAHLWVSDTGIGMDAATRARIFEPFFTTKPVGQGTGLGLSVVHGIVTAHAGGISVDSRPGDGSTFHLYLPACTPVVPLDARPPHDGEVRRGQGEHVLYVDDDETMVLVASRLLQRAGYRVSTQSNARAAIEFVREQPQAFDLIVTDFNMPDCTGLEVARAVAAIRPGLPVIISSGHLTEDLRSEASAIGVRSLLEKENTLVELCPLVAHVLGEG
jgi:PAS domain S-box-containing protein